jgi:hypothetical protein
MKIVAVVIAALVLLVIVVLLIGSRLPKEHSVSRSVVVPRTPAETYAIARDVASAPAWRPEVQGVELLAAVDGKPRFREHAKQGVVTYEIVEDAPPARFVTRIADTDLGYSGSWTYTFAPEGTGTRVTIREDGEVSNVLFRFLSRFVFGQASTIETYLKALERRAK